MTVDDSLHCSPLELALYCTASTLGEDSFETTFFVIFYDSSNQLCCIWKFSIVFVAFVLTVNVCNVFVFRSVDSHARLESSSWSTNSCTFSRLSWSLGRCTGSSYFLSLSSLSSSSCWAMACKYYSSFELCPFEYTNRFA